LARHSSIFSNGKTLSLGVALLLSAGLVLGFADGSETLDAREYSAYADPEKPVISVILSDEGNVEEFQSKFGLGSEEMETVLAAVRRENEALVQEYSESEQIVESNAGLSDEQISGKIAASDYDERVRAAVARTKSTIENLLPESQRSELEEWVNAKFAQAEQDLSEGTVGARRPGTTRGRGVACKVFATQYNGYTRYEVALPHRRLKDKGGFRVGIRRGEHRARAPVKEVGPWNIRDNYWQPRRHRDMWRSLPRCKPEAEAAYFKNFHRGRDQFGRKVLNPAGVDLTPRVAHRLRLKRYQNAWVYVRYPWARG
jgi:hypothetical protein